MHIKIYNKDKKTLKNENKSKTENPRVSGSIPLRATNKKVLRNQGFFKLVSGEKRDCFCIVI